MMLNDVGLRWKSRWKLTISRNAGMQCKMFKQSHDIKSVEPLKQLKIMFWSKYLFQRICINQFIVKKDVGNVEKGRKE